MRKHKKLLAPLIILLLIFVTALFFARSFLGRGGNDFLSTDPKINIFATGGEIDDSNRTYDRFGSFGGYTPVKLNVSTCLEGRDAVYFGLGHTEFLVEGLKDSMCVFKYGTEIENPNWDGELGTTCRVPVLTVVSLTVGDDGINFSPITQYCSGSK